MEEKKGMVEKIEGLVSVLKSLLYILSIIYPLFGIIAGIVLQNKKFSVEVRNIGRTCFWISVVMTIIIGVIVFIVL